MSKEREKKLLIASIKAARELTFPDEKLSTYKNVAGHLFKTLNRYYDVKQLRFYIKREEEILEEDVYYNETGAHPGHDFLPFYQLPDKIIIEKNIVFNEDDNTTFSLLPLTSDGNLIGMLELKTPAKPDERTMTILNEMIKSVSIGLSQSLFRRNNIFYKSYFESVLKINEQFQKNSNLDELISNFMKITVSELDLDRISVFCVCQVISAEFGN